jgi:hypothetical protein
LYGCDGRVQSVANMPARRIIYSSQNEPVSTPESASAVSNEVSHTLIGKKSTIHGRFSLDGKIPPAFVMLDNDQAVYLPASWGWGATYSEMEAESLQSSHCQQPRRRLAPLAACSAGLPDHFTVTITLFLKITFAVSYDCTVTRCDPAEIGRATLMAERPAS